MSLRGTAAGWKWWFTKEVVAPFPVILLLLSGCSAPLPRSSPSESPGESQGFRYDHRLFTVELKNVEVFDNEIKVTLMYTNRTGGPQNAGLALGPQTLTAAAAYLVDDLGNRYPYASDSFRRIRADWPPQIAEEIWISFAKARPGASSVSLIMPWTARGAPIATVTFRRIPLSPAPSGTQGFRYSHRLFMMELKNVEVVGDEVKVNLTYINRTNSAQYAGIAGGSFGEVGAYLVDNLGKRYQYISDSFGKSRSDFPAQAPEEIWITFGKLQPGASSVNLLLPWSARGAATVTVTFRGIPLPQ